MVQHGIDTKRHIDVVNLDPAAEYFDYNPLVDVRELIQVEDTMEDEELHFGPNGGLIFCIEYLLENSDWLQNKLGDQEDDYILFDCPGQIELYTHLTAIRKLINLLQNWNFNVCSVFLVDVQFMTDGAKFLSGTMAALSVMVNLEIPHVNLLSKMDLLSKSAKKQLDRFLEPDSHAILGDIELRTTRFNEKHQRLTEAIGRLVEDYSLVRFIPLNLKDNENVADVLLTIDNVIQFGEDQDVKVKEFEALDPEDDDGG
ncbi:GPN-loop GTPase 3 isoform X2 [Agrilus planipennis]|nr:GPN-loop GTPase 3 isoform X2 [Agrilus planipennis]